MKKYLVFSAILLSLFASIVAKADTFAFNFAAADFSGAGFFQANTTSPGIYLINGVSGTVNTGNGAPKVITGLLPVAPDLNSFESNDNLLFYPARANGNFFDRFGVSFVLSNGAEVNLFNSASFLMRAGGAVVQESAVINVVPTPEPSSLLLLGSGLASGLALVRRRWASVQDCS